MNINIGTFARVLINAGFGIRPGFAAKSIASRKEYNNI